MVIPITMPAMIAAIRIPDPVADIQFSTYTAASGVGFGTTGGTRTTRLCKPSIGNLGAESALSRFFICGRPHTKTSTLRMAHGVQAFMTCARVKPCRTALDSASAYDTVVPSRDVLVQTCFGCQILRNSVSAPIEQIAAITSTSHGP